MSSIPNEIRPDHSGDNTALNTRDLYLFWSNPAPPSWLIQTERVTPQLQLGKHSKVGNGFSWHIPGFHPSHVMVICLSSMCSVLKAGGLCLSHSHLIKILLSRTHPDPTPRSALTHQTSWVILSELNQHQHSTCRIILIPWLSACRGWSWQNHFTWDYIPRNIHFNIH